MFVAQEADQLVVTLLFGWCLVKLDQFDLDFVAMVLRLSLVLTGT